MPWRSTRPPSAAARAAQRALDIRAKQAPSNRAGTPVGIARAGQFANRERMSISTIKRIVSFFARHEKSSGSAQAWGLWGGNPGRAWARRELARYNREKGA